jgi:DNA recombination protein RmuC
MNIDALIITILALVALAFGVAWLLTFREAGRLRRRAQEAENEVIRLQERARFHEDARVAMGEQFQLLSQSTLEQSTNALLKRAEESFTARERLALERMDNTLKPVAETLTKVEAQVKLMEEERLKDTGGLRSEITQLLQASNATRDVTLKLANALRRGAGVQGRWGEETLRNVLQAAGLTRFDFTEQHSLDTEEGRRRPDVTVKLPGGVFVIDSKVNLTAFLEAMEATDDEAREMHLQRHAQALRAHVRDLSAKAYWDQFKADGSPDFVALFIPGDGFLAAALDRVPELMSEAMDKRVIITTPTTLFALCKAVAYGWRVEDQMKNAATVAELGKELYARLSVMGGHIGAVGDALGRAVNKYNDFVGSLESKVLTQARRFEDLKVEHQGKALPELTAVEAQPKALSKLGVE